MKEVHTVTCFLESDGEVLILLRSQQVRTFKGIWGGVSGLIENGMTSDTQALQEIQEETGLERDDIQLLKKSEAQIILDPNRNLKKIVYPYLFQVVDRSKVKINWEHTVFKWIKPEEIDNYPTMPELKETLQRVLPISFPIER